MYFVESNATDAFMPLGSSRLICSISARTALMTSSEFAFGRTQMPMKVAARPLMRTS